APAPPPRPVRAPRPARAIGAVGTATSGLAPAAAGRGDLRVLCRPDPRRPRSRGRSRAVDAHVRLPGVLSAVHPLRRRADPAGTPTARAAPAGRPGALPLDPRPL